MKVFQVILQIGILYGLYYVGVWIQQTFHLLMPGSIIGMLLLFGLLCTKKFKLAWIDQGASFLLSHLPLLFVPVTVGVIDFFDLFKGRGLLSIVVIVLSTILVMAISAIISQMIALKSERNLMNRTVSNGVKEYE